MKAIPIWLSAFIVTMFGCISSPRAQAIDYGALQDLFGEPVTTNATGTPQRASEVAGNMTIITADQIRQSGNRDIPQIIGEYVTGMDILRSSSEGYDVGVRGYNQIFEPSLLVLVDGRQVFVDDYSRTIWNNIPVNIDDIRQIEVVKGPSSALFGSNAANGVVNIITYSPIHDNNTVATAGLGTQNQFNADGTVTKNGEWGGTKTSVGGMNASGFDVGRLASDNNGTEKPTRRYATNSSVFQLTPTVTANTEITYSDSAQDVAVNVADALDGEKTRTYSLRAGVSGLSRFGQITMDNYYNHTYDELNSENVSKFNTDLFVSGVNDQFKLGSDNTFRVGVEYRNRREQYVNSLQGDVPPILSENNYAVDGTWLWQITDQLALTSAAREDHVDMENVGPTPAVTPWYNSQYSHSINETSFNSGLTYKASDLDTLRATYGRGVQMPSLLQSAFNFYEAAESLSYVGNPTIKPLITQNYELGYDHKISELYSTAKISPFYSLTQDVAQYQGQGLASLGGHTVYLYELQNLGNSSSYGTELEFQGAHDQFRWDASYSYARVTDSQPVLTGQDFQQSVPEHHFRLNGGYTYGKWEFDGNGQLMSSSSMLRATTLTSGGIVTPTDGYLSLGGRIGYNIVDNVTIALSGTNLSEHTTVESPYPAIQRQVFLNLTGRF